MYLYEGHLGSLYTSDCELDYEDLYCEQCGGSDICVGYADTREEAWELLKSLTNNGYDYKFVWDFIYENFQ